MLTAFGKLLRKIRIDRSLLLKDMADMLQVSAAYLSAVETGKKPVNDAFVERVAGALGYRQGSTEYVELKVAALSSRDQIALDTAHVSPAHRDVAVAFARKFENLDQAALDRLRELLK